MEQIIKKSILIIEDDQELQNSLKMVLESENYNVYTANNGKEGLELLKKIPTPCLILLDLLMPIMNGWEFAEKIGNDLILASIPIIVVSAFENETKSLRASGFIQKPINLDALLTAIKKHCG